MPPWRLAKWLVLVWTLTMATWLVLYREEEVTCGPEIYENCQIGLKVTAGLGRPGIVLLWALGVVALAMTGLTTRRPRSKAVRRVVPLYRGFVTLAVVVFPVAVVLGYATSKPPRPRPPAEGVRVSVLSADLQRAVSRSGRRRHRARLSVHVRVTNLGPRRIADVKPVLLARRARVRPDPFARGTTGSLLRPVPPRFTAGGTLRFETAGAVTGRLVTTRRAQLQIAGQTVALTIRVLRTVSGRQIPRPRKKARPTSRALPAPAFSPRAAPRPRAAPPPPPPARGPAPAPPARRPPPPPPPPPPPAPSIPFDDSG